MKMHASVFFALLLTLCLLAAPWGAAANAVSYSAVPGNVKPGDLDGDGQVAPADARIALRVSVKLDELDETLRNAADVDGDGAVTSADARTILRVAVNLETLPEQPAAFEGKVGLICVHDENAGYDLGFIEALRAAAEELGLSEEQLVIRRDVPEDETCLTACEDLVKEGCTVIFGDSYGYEDFMIEAAKAHPDVDFCHAGGVKAHTEGLANYHNAYAAVYEGRYLTGVAAGMKLNEMIEKGEIAPDKAKLGFVGAFTYAQVISSYTAFFLGARSVCPTATMEVFFTGAWYDETLEKHFAEKLIQSGCQVISQYSDSYGAPTTCNLNGVLSVAYSASVKEMDSETGGNPLVAFPNTCLMSCAIDWTPYFVHAIKAAASGTLTAEADWTGNLATGSVVLTEVNETVAAPGTEDAVLNAKIGLIESTLKVFDTSTFTVNGETVTSYMADVDFDWEFTGDTQAVADGYFNECAYRSAPYFDIWIDGITMLNMVFG